MKRVFTCSFSPPSFRRPLRVEISSKGDDRHGSWAGPIFLCVVFPVSPKFTS